jgi:hypothetical protein
VSELFDEVDEDVRRDQLKKLWEKYSVVIIAGAILIIASVGGWRGCQYVAAKKAAEAGAAFADLVAKAPFGYRVLSRLRLAAEIAARDPQAAAKMFDEIAADRSVGAAEQDLARIRSAQLLLESTSYPNMKERLEASAATGATFRHTARELLALSAWRANDASATRQWLDMIANDGQTPPSLRSRAEALQALLPPVAKS